MSRTISARETLDRGMFVCGCGREFDSRKGLGIHRLRTEACRSTPEEQAASDRESAARWQRNNREKRNEMQRAYRQTPKGRALFDAYTAQQRTTNKGKARTALYNAVAQGRITRQPCEICGAEPTHGHHAFGYEPENWLRVQWLCQRHHQEIHNAAA